MSDRTARLFRSTNRSHTILSGLSAAFLCLSATADEPPEAGRYPGFNGYHREITTEVPEAQAWFDQGIQLLYGFNHDEAIRSFERAAEIDPSCAMAWWGSAYARGLHINNPEMGEDQSRMAHEVAAKAVAALDDETPVEKALVRAVAHRYRWATTGRSR